ncbi:hypothetical protein [Haladaptatus sp. DFWS20]
MMEPAVADLLFLGESLAIADSKITAPSPTDSLLRLVVPRADE